MNMGVPDEVEAPHRKRPRLSLGLRLSSSSSNSQTKSKRKSICDDDVFSGKPVDIPSTPGISTCENLNHSASSGTGTSAEDPICLDKKINHLVPPVTSLLNLGNTCYMNCMLQVLRYTPGYVPVLHHLKTYIEAEENKPKQQSDEIEAVDDTRHHLWKFIKSSHKFFTSMEDKEYHYEDDATDDAASMAVSPYTLLDSIRNLNPMFEGTFQHDAQECLRCMLCYVEDCEKELLKSFNNRKDHIKAEEGIHELDCSRKDSVQNVSRIKKSENNKCAKDKLNMKSVVRLNKGRSPSCGVNPVTSQSFISSYMTAVSPSGDSNSGKNYDECSVLSSVKTSGDGDKNSQHFAILSTSREENYSPSDFKDQSIATTTCLTPKSPIKVPKLVSSSLVPGCPADVVRNVTNSALFKDCSRPFGSVAKDSQTPNVCETEQFSSAETCSFKPSSPETSSLNNLSLQENKGLFKDKDNNSVKEICVRLQRCNDFSSEKTKGNEVLTKKLIKGETFSPVSRKSLSFLFLPKLDFNSNLSRTLAEQLFAGYLVHQTRCLECETVSHRKEAFMDISIPVTSPNISDSDNEEEDSSQGTPDTLKTTNKESCISRLMQTFSKVEVLRDDEKYWCDTCVNYVEAERSCQYNTLPSLLTLHLKRFSANAGLFGSVSKLSDKVGIPLTLPCIHHNCQKGCTLNSHRYYLYAVVTHSGTSIFNGHYRAYVKVQQLVNPVVYYNLVQYQLNLNNNSFSNISKGNLNNDEKCSQSKLGNESFWLECDDESIRMMDEDEFESRLDETDGALMGTPYVLFYHKLLDST